MPTALCDPATGQCTVGCFSNNDCAYVADTPVCDLSTPPAGGTAAQSGTCVQCLEPAECVANHGPSSCDPVTHRCGVTCSGPADCALSYAGCLNGTCGGCAVNADCPNTQTCTAGACTCSSDAQCTGRDAPSCTAGADGNSYCGCGAGCGPNLVCDTFYGKGTNGCSPSVGACLPSPTYPGGALCSISGRVVDPALTTSNPCVTCDAAGDNSLCAKNLNGAVCVLFTGSSAPVCACEQNSDCPAGVCSANNSCIASCVGGPPCPAGTSCNASTGLCN